MKYGILCLVVLLLTGCAASVPNSNTPPPNPALSTSDIMWLNYQQMRSLQEQNAFYERIRQLENRMLYEKIRKIEEIFMKLEPEGGYVKNCHEKTEAQQLATCEPEN